MRGPTSRRTRGAERLRAVRRNDEGMPDASLAANGQALHTPLPWVQAPPGFAVSDSVHSSGMDRLTTAVYRMAERVGFEPSAERAKPGGRCTRNHSLRGTSAVSVAERVGFEPSAERAKPGGRCTRNHSLRGTSAVSVAEREGFEPTVEFPLHTLSKRAPSTTRTSLRVFRISSLQASG